MTIQYIAIGALVFTAYIGGSALWRMGGNGKDYCRDFIFPVLIGGCKAGILALLGHGWLSLAAFGYFLLFFAMLRLFSYGVSAPPHKAIVWLYKMLTGVDGSNGNVRVVEVAVRALCGFFWSLAGVAFTCLTGNWGLFIGYVIFLTIANGLIGGLVEDVEVSERGVGACVATVILV